MNSKLTYPFTKEEILSDIANSLLTWANGSTTETAAVTLLIETGLLIKVNHHIRVEIDGIGRANAWLPWGDIAPDLGSMALSGGERRIIEVVLSLAGWCKIDLGEVVTGLDSTNARHVVEAILYANTGRWQL